VMEPQMAEMTGFQKEKRMVQKTGQKKVY